MSNQPELLEIALPATEAKPLDQKILGGIALTSFYDEEEVNRVVRRLNNSFDTLRADESKEFAECIAYGVNLPEDVQVQIDDVVVDVANRQNHGMVATAHDKGQIPRFLWGGRDEKTNKYFYLGKHLAPIVFDDPEASVRPGVIYSLSSHCL